MREVAVAFVAGVACEVNGIETICERMVLWILWRL
jgi:hypothetical protein